MSALSGNGLQVAATRVSRTPALAVYLILSLLSVVSPCRHAILLRLSHLGRRLHRIIAVTHASAARPQSSQVVGPTRSSGRPVICITNMRF